MNVDSLQNGFSQLVLIVTASFAGTLHSPIPLDSPVLQPQTIHAAVIEQSQQIITPTYKKGKPVPSATPTNSPPPTNTPTPTSLPTSTPTIKPENPSPTLSATPAVKKQEISLDIPQPEPVTIERSLNPDVLLQLINQHREGLKLPAFVKDEQLCKVAEYRRPQLYDEIFTNGNVHKGFYDLHLPYYITENMAHYESEQAILNWWLGSSIHRAAIEGNATYSCGACAGNSCAQLFTSYTPKN